MKGCNLFQIRVIFKITNWLQQNGATHYSSNSILQCLEDFYGGGSPSCFMIFYEGGSVVLLNILCSVGLKMSVDSKVKEILQER